MKKCILGHFQLENMAHITSNLFKKGFGTWKYAFLSTNMMFYDIFALACKENKISRFWTRTWPKSLGLLFSWFFFLIFFFLFFLSFCYSYTVDLLLGLVPSSRISEKASLAQEILTMECWGKFWSNFFSQISEHFCISGSIDPLTLIWKRSFPPAEHEYNWCQFWSKVMTG